MRYADLNLGTAAGNDALYARLVSAARKVCGETGDIRELGQLAATQACQREAIANAVRACTARSSRPCTPSARDRADRPMLADGHGWPPQLRRPA